MSILLEATHDEIHEEIRELTESLDRLDWIEQLPDSIKNRDFHDILNYTCSSTSVSIRMPLDKALMNQIAKEMQTLGWEELSGKIANVLKFPIDPEEFGPEYEAVYRLYVTIYFEPTVAGATCKLIPIHEEVHSYTHTTYDIVCEEAEVPN